MRGLAILGLVAFAAASVGCGGTTSSAATTSQAAQKRPPTQRATLKIQSTSPLTVAGVGFLPRERVRISTDAEAKNVRAGDAGGFVVRFTRTNPCGSVTVVARGSGGSRAQFNLSHANVSNVHCL